MALDCIEISALVQALRLHRAAPEGTLASRFDQSSKCRFGIRNQHPQHAVQIAIVEDLTAALQLIVIGKNLFGASYVARGSFNFDGVRAEVYIDVQAIFQHMQVFVTGAEQGLDVRADFNTLLHSNSVFRVPSSAVAHFQTLDVACEIEERPAAFSQRIVLRHMRWGDNTSVKSVPFRFGASQPE